ncbi:unnamed protein product [Chrysodeixis includens]|uniref:Uncharacterized protein n=1 Tax=Chrysodeixis includens TaxID=689277 RepID=A0A9P0BS74_CHRIL|nr:unnamed protein product [Chrysodeixis includens]
MAGVLFIVNVPKKDYESDLKKNLIPNLVFEKEKYDRVSKVIHELKEKHFVKTDCVASCVQDEDNVVISKCRSTDCLHRHKEAEFKCKSESFLADAQDERKSYVKASWDEIKQVIKLKKNKLKITRPVRGDDILDAFHWDTPLETILSEVVDRLDIKNAAWNSTKDDKFWQVLFSLETGNLSEELLQVLKTFGIGSRHQSSVSVLPCALYYKSNDGNSAAASEDGSTGIEELPTTPTAWSRFSSSVRARTNLAQVLHDVRADAALTFDWLFMLLVAAFVAAIGLIENSTVILVASMLISPLMGPITAGTLGTAVRDRSLQLMGVKNEFLGLFLSLVIGFIFGLTICAIDERYGVVEDWPTYEMISRCEYRSLWVGILVAIPSGAGVALAVLGEYTASLVGVAISASLLPPAVNAGLLWAMALTRLTVTTEELRWLVVQPSELAVLGTASLCLTLVNIVCIFLAGVAVYKVKEVSPLDRKDISWWRANRNRFHGTKQNKENLNWDAYTKWYEESPKTKEKSESPAKDEDIPTSGVQSDTITYRRRPSLIKRLRAQNVEGFCNHTRLGELYIPLDTETNAEIVTHREEIDKTDDTTNSDITNCDTEMMNDNEDSSTDESKSHSYYNMGYQTDEVDINSHPTIEPSLSFTMDPKKPVLLENKSFNV